MWMQIEKEQLIADLKRIGIAEGDHVSIALSFKSMGHIKGGPEAFLESLLSVIGAEGTLMVNTFTNLFPISKIPCDYVFDSASTVPNTGLVPRTFLKLKGAVRSRHPSVSVAAVGKYAKYLTKDHNEGSSFYLPYEKLARLGGKCLFIGIDDRLVGIRHEAQRRAGLWVVPMTCGARYLDSEGEVKLFVMRMPPCVTSNPMLVPVLEGMNLLKRGKVGEADSILAPVKGLLDALTEMLKQDPTLNLCDDVLCLLCRELERRLDLYGRIRCLHLFQRNLFLRKVVNLRNKLALKQYSYVAYSNSTQKTRKDPYQLIENILTRILKKTRNARASLRYIKMCMLKS
jgi:aminoglycoside N3'-acetyltransferase